MTTGPLRLLCVDVGDATPAVSASAVTRAVAMASSWDRLLCFGRAAAVAASLNKQERAEREGVWLDVAAAWLLATDSVVDPPARPRPGPLESRVIAIGTPGLEAGGLAVSEQLVELAGALLVMAVPGRNAIDAVDNAHVWLVGGTPFSVDTEQGKAGGRAVVGVGGSITGVVVDNGEARITSWDLAGTVVHESTVPIGGSNRLSVRSASA
jgi:hypothetical protein